MQIPIWFPRLTELLHGAASNEARPAIERRSAELARRWHVLDENDWRKLEYQCKAIIVREARSHCPSDATDCLAAIDRVLELLDAETPAEDPAWEIAAARWAVSGAMAGRAAARSAAAGRMISAIFDAIEKAISARQ